MSEQRVINQLKEYRRIVARIRILERTPVGAGITVSTLSGDDKLQELHRQLRGQPTYMYLTSKEQNLETTAHAYLTMYPAGTRAQKAAVPRSGADLEDDEQLRQIRRAIQKVIEVRGGHPDAVDAAIERLSELQDLMAEKERIDDALEALGEYKPQLSDLLRLRYIEEQSVVDVSRRLSIARKTFDRWRMNAIEEYARIAGL